MSRVAAKHNKVTPADGAGPLRFAYVAQWRATAEFALGCSTQMNPWLLMLVVALTGTSCGYPDQFKNTGKDAPHAVLRGTKSPKAGHVFATHINGQPTSFWRSGDTFRIRPGKNVVRVAFSDRRETVGFKPMQFVCLAGGDYVIERKQDPGVLSPLAATPHPSTKNSWVIHDRRDQVIIRQADAAGSEGVMAEAPKEDYIFGRSSAEEAMAAYRKKNP
jgi:hypothetical protein